MDTIKTAVLTGCLALATLTHEVNGSNPVLAKQPPTTASTVVRCTLDAARIGAYTYYSLKHNRGNSLYDVSVLYAITWGATDLYDIYEALFGSDQRDEVLEDLDDIILVLDREQETAINASVERIKNSLLPIVNTALPLASAWLSSNGDHILALRLQSIASLTRLAEVWINHPSSTQKRLLGVLLLMHVAKTVNDFTMQSKNQLFKTDSQRLMEKLETVPERNGITDQPNFASTEHQQEDEPVLERTEIQDETEVAHTSQQNLRTEAEQQPSEIVSQQGRASVPPLGTVKDINTFTKNFIQQLQEKSNTQKPINQATIEQSGRSNNEPPTQSLSDKALGDVCPIL